MFAEAPPVSYVFRNIYALFLKRNVSPYQESLAGCGSLYAEMFPYAVEAVR